MLSSVRCAILAFAAVLLFSTACDSITGFGGRRAVGILEWQRTSARQGLTSLMSSSRAEGPDSRVSAPDTVEVDASFEVVVTTIGSNSCWEAAGTDVTVSDLLAVVVPYDRDRTLEERDLVCADAEKRIRHDVRITFRQRGDALLRIHGRKVVGANPANGTPILVEKRIHVR